MMLGSFRNKKIQACLLAMTLTTSMVASAKRTTSSALPLPHFKTGTYKLTGGERSLCGEGVFELTNGNKNILLGPYHGFLTSNKDHSDPGGAPGDEGCRYDSKNSLIFKAEVTELIYSEDRICGETKKSHLEKHAYISGRKISLNVERTGEDPQRFNCFWTRVQELIDPVIVDESPKKPEGR